MKPQKIKVEEEHWLLTVEKKNNCCQEYKGDCDVTYVLMSVMLLLFKFNTDFTTLVAGCFYPGKFVTVLL